METLLAGSWAMSCWIAVFVAAGGMVDISPAPGSERRRLRRTVLRCAEALGHGAFANLLLEHAPWQAASVTLCRKLQEKGIVLDQEGGCGMILLAAGLCAIAACLSSLSLLGALVVGGAVALAVPLWDGSRRRRVSRELAQEMPAVFRTLAMALTAGETLSQAIEYVGRHEQGPAGEAFLRAGLRLRCGDSVESALGNLRKELDAPGSELLVDALLISQRTGSPLRELFLSSARLVERQGEFERALDVKTAQVRLSVRIVCLLPPVLVGGLSMLSIDFRQGLTTPVGLTCIAIALVLDGIAVIIIRQLMRSVL